MILQIRTKDNLEDLLRHGNSPSWVVSEGKINDIEKVEIYQFDGKRVLKADFDKILSSRTESGRLIVAFSKGSIEDCDHKWIGQNPIKYSRGNETIHNNNSTMESNPIKVGFYAGKTMMTITMKNVAMPEINQTMFFWEVSKIIMAKRNLLEES